MWHKGYFEQVAITKGEDGQTACGSFAGIYTRLDDPEVFGWMKEVIFGTTVQVENPCNNRCGVNAEPTLDCYKQRCRCPWGYVGDPYVRCSDECTPDSCGANADCEYEQEWYRTTNNHTKVWNRPYCRCRNGYKGNF